MALAARLELRQGQGLVITPQLQQAIKLLQLSNVELEAFVETELEKNPLLARDDGPAAPDADAGEPASSEHLSEVSLDRLADAQAGEGMDARHDDLYADAQAGEGMDARHDDLYADASPGDRATGDAGEAAQEGFSEGFQAGGTVDW